MKYWMRFSQQLFAVLGVGLLAAPIGFYGWLHSLRPPRIDQEQVLFQGITYQRSARNTPRPLMIHTIAIDLTTTGIRPLVTPSEPWIDDMQVSARTTSEFLKQFKLQLAVNASFFYPFREKTPWNYHPRTGDRVRVMGEAMSNGQLYTPEKQYWTTICFLPKRAEIAFQGDCPKGTTQAVAGIVILVEQGKPAYHRFKSKEDAKPYSRVAVAIDKTGEKVWFVVVDGKQPLYSEGVTIPELAEIMAALGAETALNLDGGGSTTLVIDTPTGAKVLNAPMHTKLPMRERPVANHVGFYAFPKE
jgi:hypothetical protein